MSKERMNKLSEKKINKKSKSRQMALQALYEWQISGNSLADVEEFILEVNNAELGSADLKYFKDLFINITKNIAVLDASVEPYLSRSVNSVNPIEHAILRIGMYEILFKKDVPPKVILNEAIELAKIFGAMDGYKFINAALDKAMILRK